MYATSPARSIVDATCATSYEVGVVLADAALRQGLVTPTELTAMADRLKHREGSSAARAAAAFADGRSESVGESPVCVC